MNQSDGDRILQMIGQQIPSQFQVEQFSDQYFVVTPMLYPDNTPITLAIEFVNDHRAVLADNGEAADYAFVNGLDEAIIRDRINKTMKRFHLSKTRGGELVLEVSVNSIAEGIFSLAAAVQDIAYLVYSARSADAPLRLKQVIER